MVPILQFRRPYERMKYVMFSIGDRVSCLFTYSIINVFIVVISNLLTCYAHGHTMWTTDLGLVLLVPMFPALDLLLNLGLNMLLSDSSM